MGTILSKESALAAGISVIEDGRYSQALHDTVVAYRAARRSGTANSKSKAEVNLSGAKPWRQKGTGRARAGYKSSPVWVGGGVVFGPEPRSYRKKVPRSVKRLALLKALSVRVLAGHVECVPEFSVDSGKTRDFVKSIASFNGSSTVLIVSDSFSKETYLAARNVTRVQLLLAEHLNAEDVLRFKKIIATSSGIAQLAKRVNI
jgi:large subunit ribosomal protein L4